MLRFPPDFIGPLWTHNTQKTPLLHGVIGLCWIVSEGEVVEAAARLPNRARVHYNHALILQHLDRRSEAETVLKRANGIDSNDLDIIYALAVFYAQDRRWREALPYAQTLTEISPNTAEPRQLLTRIQGQLASADGEPGAP